MSSLLVPEHVAAELSGQRGAPSREGVDAAGAPTDTGWYAVVNNASEYVRLVKIGRRLRAQRVGHPGLFTVGGPSSGGAFSGMPHISGHWRKVSELEEWT